MDIERNITIEQEDEDQSAEDRPTPYTTFVAAAASMPRYSKDELARGREEIETALAELEAESAPPEPAGANRASPPDPDSTED